MLKGSTVDRPLEVKTVKPSEAAHRWVDEWVKERIDPDDPDTEFWVCTGQRRTEEKKSRTEEKKS